MEYFSWLNNLPHALSTTIIAMTPLAELRASIPIALGVYKMPVGSVLFFSVLGDMIPAILILLCVGQISGFLRQHSKIFDHLFSWWFKSTKKKFSDGFAKYGLMALFLFVAIPLPGTGSWSGALAAFLFRLPIWPSLLAILGGVIVAGGLVTGASLGILSFF